MSGAMTTAIFITTSNNKTPKSLNWRHLVFPCTVVDTMADSSQLTQGGSKVRWPCQSTIVGVACAELRHSDRNLRTAWFKKEDFKIGIKKEKKHWVDFNHYRMDVYSIVPSRFRETQVDLFASRESFHHQLYYSLSRMRRHTAGLGLYVSMRFPHWTECTEVESVCKLVFFSPKRLLKTHNWSSAFFPPRKVGV